MALSMDRWKNKVAVVTGASAGIGEAICKLLVEDGLQVVGFARRADRLEKLSKELQNKKGKFHHVQVDVSKEEDVVRGFKWTTDNVGPVSILVNNAGIIRVNSLTGDASVAKWREIMDTNVVGLCLCTKEAVNIMNNNKIEGHVIHINSIAGHDVPTIPLLNLYPPSKYAVTALRDVLENELRAAGKHIRVTSISPGLVQTEIGVAAGLDLTKFPAYNTGLISEDIAEAVRYALSTPQRVTIKELTVIPTVDPPFDPSVMKATLTGKTTSN